MSTSFKNIFLLLLSTGLFFLVSCKGKSKTGTEKEVDYAAQGYIAATVVDYNVDGCIWMIQMADGKKYEPQNLEDTYRKDQQKVWIKYEVQKNAMTICMGGAVIKITDMKERK
jgi:hypothetical protein